MLWVESSGIEVRSATAALAPLDGAAAAELERIRADPGGMWDGPAWALAATRVHPWGVELGGAGAPTSS